MGHAVATIHSLFKDRAFEPELLQQMGEALDLVKRAMPDVTADEIALVIIAAAQRGVTDAAMLGAETLQLLTQQRRKQA